MRNGYVFVVNGRVSHAPLASPNNDGTAFVSPAISLCDRMIFPAPISKFHPRIRRCMEFPLCPRRWTKGPVNYCFQKITDRDNCRDVAECFRGHRRHRRSTVDISPRQNPPSMTRWPMCWSDVGPKNLRSTDAPGARFPTSPSECDGIRFQRPFSMKTRCNSRNQLRREKYRTFNRCAGTPPRKWVRHACTCGRQSQRLITDQLPNRQPGLGQTKFHPLCIGKYFRRLLRRQPLCFRQQNQVIHIGPRVVRWIRRQKASRRRLYGRAICARQRFHR